MKTGKFATLTSIGQRSPFSGALYFSLGRAFAVFVTHELFMIHRHSTDNNSRALRSGQGLKSR